MPWIAFAQNGNPNCGQLPEEWAIYGFGKRAAMILVRQAAWKPIRSAKKRSLEERKSNTRFHEPKNRPACEIKDGYIFCFERKLVIMNNACSSSLLCKLRVYVKLKIL
ncbi:hypothetical protein [Parageobacillus thermoglucosidasius]|uniref:hypothetical protein n=1 Tax=Parageobacillus thermoglucosidasius TaxID=1426 RepID=UPI000F625662|nr:hypothetical protein [Parageobacillus thermoglucosidasius]